MLHQPARYFNLVEVDKDATESIFYYLRDKGYHVYIEPSQELISRYMLDEKESWIVKLLVSEAPTQEVNGIRTATLEKILVDIFCDPIIFNSQQGSEMHHIFQESFNKYTISESKLLRYADRRGKKTELDDYLNKVSKYRQ